MVGIARKKENSAAERLSTLSSNAPVIVAPERDTPGIKATTWQIPILKQSESGNFSILLCIGTNFSLSTNNKISPPISKVEQIKVGDSKRTFFINPCINAPIVAAGIVAIISPKIKWRELGFEGKVRSKFKSFAE